MYLLGSLTSEMYLLGSLIQTKTTVRPWFLIFLGFQRFFLPDDLRFFI